MDWLLAVAFRIASRLAVEGYAAPLLRLAQRRPRAARAWAALELQRDNPVALFDEPLRQTLEATGEGNLLLARAERALGRLDEARLRLSGLPDAQRGGGERLLRQIDLASGEAGRIVTDCRPPADLGKADAADVSLWLSALRAANADGASDLDRLDRHARGKDRNAPAIAATLIHHYARTGRQADASLLLEALGERRDDRILAQTARLALWQRNPEAAAGWIGRIAQSKPRAALELALALARSRTAEAQRLIDRQIRRRGPTLRSAYLAGHVALWREDHARAEGELRHALERDPDFGEAAADLAMCLDCSGRPGEALAALARLDRLVFRPRRLLPVEPGIDLPSRASATRHRAALLARLGRGAEAAESLRGFAGMDAQALAEWSGKPQWSGEALDGRNVLVLAARGVGDELRHLAAGRDRLERCHAVTLTCDPRLAELLAGSVARFAILPVERSRLSRRLSPAEEQERMALPPRLRRAVNAAAAEAARGADLIVDAERLGEIAAVARTSAPAGDRPLLNVPAAAADRWRDAIATARSGRPLIGLSWRGLVRSYQRDVHYLAPDDLRPLLQNAVLDFLPLQAGMTELERETLAAIAGSRLRDVQGLDLTDDFAGMAAACLACDLVVSVGTALAELSGAVGARTLLALPHTSAIAQGRAGPDGSDRYWPAARCLARAHGENRQQFSARLADAAVRSLNGGRR